MRVISWLAEELSFSRRTVLKELLNSCGWWGIAVALYFLCKTCASYALVLDSIIL
jgi:hypothetical protein